MSSKVIVLGSGILGFSVASVLKWAGHDVSLVGECVFTEERAAQDPLFASAYPAASIIPHTVRAPNVTELVGHSIPVFAKLCTTQDSGVREQRHFEIREGEIHAPQYAAALKDFQLCTPAQIPIARNGAQELSGYSFSCYFCDMPSYGPWLVQLARRLEVPFVRRTIDWLWLCGQSPDYFVNCLGAGAYRVFEDLEPGKLFRGILLLAPFDTEVRDVVSYNYTPSIHLYPSFESGKAADVYFYPRNGHCVLGGTRQPGSLNASGEFESEGHSDVEQIEIHGLSVPKPILELNQELVLQLTGKSIGEPYQALVGYRHVDVDSAGNERLALELRDRQGIAPVIDCFGFGGAGVTLSWGAAIEVLRLINGDLPSNAAEQMSAYMHQIS